MAAKKTASKGAGRATAPRQPAKRLIPEKGQLIVRMYRQGLGDCFLLAGCGEDGEPRYLLIDCGVHARQTDGPKRLAQVLDDLVVSTGSHIHTVVATHEHADHLSGFVQKGSPFLRDDFTIGAAWLAWTERRGDRQADALRKKRGAAQRLIEQATQQAQQRAGIAGQQTAKRLLEITDFERPADGSVDENEALRTIRALGGKTPHAAVELFTDAPAVLGAAKKKPKGPSSNEIALQLLALKAREGACYCEPGSVQELAGVENLRAYVLAPPRSDLLENENPTKIRGAKEGDPGGVYKEVYLTSAFDNRSLELSPRLGLEISALGAELAGDHDWRYPFSSAFRRLCDFASPEGTGPGHCWSGDELPPESTKTFIRQTYFAPEESWRRIDGDWLGAAESVALNLVGDTNNTSLVLAFEWGEAGSGVVLLFPGDAQVGNWLSWRDQTYGKKRIKVDDLLSRVLVYKVGHHGSHNATVRRDPRDTSGGPNGAPFGLELMNDIVAMIPVDWDAAKKEMPDPWRMPHDPLYRRLREKARRRVLRSDLEVTPLDAQQDGTDIVPDKQDWQPVPGLRGTQWRRSAEEFQFGTKGPLYFDVMIPLPE